jgi:hypothetical protein
MTIAGRAEVADFMTAHAKVVLIVGDLPPVVGHRPLFPRRWRSPCRKDPRRIGVERAVDHQRVVLYGTVGQPPSFQCLDFLSSAR